MHPYALDDYVWAASYTNDASYFSCILGIVAETLSTIEMYNTAQYVHIAMHSDCQILPRFDSQYGVWMDIQNGACYAHQEMRDPAMSYYPPPENLNVMRSSKMSLNSKII